MWTNHLSLFLKTQGIAFSLTIKAKQKSSHYQKTGETMGIYLHVLNLDLLGSDG